MTPLTIGIASLLWTSLSSADDATVITPSPEPSPQPTVVVVEPTPQGDMVSRRERNGPNGQMIVGGIVTFGVSYGTAAIVGATSEHQGDDHLYVPIVGPWLDFADRGACGPPTSASCASETGNKVLLAVDGVFQAIGVLSVAGGFLFTGTHESTTMSGKAAEPTLQIAPVQYGRSGFGLSAVGSF